MSRQNDSTKESYLRPESEVFTTEPEGFLCVSGGDSEIKAGGANVQGFEDGGSYDITVF